MRVSRGVSTREKHRKILKAAKGMQHSRTSSFRLAKQAVIKALRYAYRDRRNKKRSLKSLWITRINAASRENGVSYSVFSKNLKNNNIKLNSKMLSEIATKEPKAFSEIVKVSK